MTKDYKGDMEEKKLLGEHKVDMKALRKQQEKSDEKFGDIFTWMDERVDSEIRALIMREYTKERFLHVIFVRIAFLQEQQL